MKLRSMILLMLLALAIPLLVACGDDEDDDDNGGGETTATSPSGAASPTGATGGAGDGEPVVIGSKNFTEQLILGEMYAQLLEAAGIEVERSLNLGGTAVAHEALVAGEIDMYPEYTGTGLLTILEMETMSDPDEVFTVVSEAYAEQFDLVWLDQTPMNNTQALAVKREFSEENGLTTISQMVEMASELRLAAVPDFPERPDGLVGLNEVYGDFEFQEIIILDPGLKYQALINDDAEVVVAFGTDGQIAGYDLVVLEDDQGLWPPYHVAPVIRQETLDAYPQIADIFNELAPLLTSEVMADLNWMVDGDDAMEPEDVPRPDTTASSIQFEHVSKQFRGSQAAAVDDVSLEVEPGELVVLLGPSGCGKTTLLKMVNRLYEPTGGRILLDGLPVGEMSTTALRRGIGYVIQQTGLFPHMRVADNIAVVPKLLGWKREAISQRVDELLDLVGLPAKEYRRRYPAQLSGGQQQRVGLARALAGNPTTLLMDEPFGALDAITRSRLQEELRLIHDRLGQTVLFVTHDIEEAVRLADRIVIMRAGQVVQYDEPLRIVMHPADEFVSDLVGAGDVLRRLSLVPVSAAAQALEGTPPDGPTIVESANLRTALAQMLEDRAERLTVVDDTGQPTGSLDLAAIEAAGVAPVPEVQDVARW